MIVNLKILAFVMLIALILVAILSLADGNKKYFFEALLFIEGIVIASWAVVLFVITPLFDW